MAQPLNYRHLHYFWVVAHEGGIARAAARLDMAVQTVSAQVRALEAALGCALLRPAGRGLALTEAGQVALAEADRIFQIGAGLPALVRGVAQQKVVRFAVGVADAVPKLAVRALLGEALEEDGLRLVCREGGLDELLAELALHRLDVVLSDRPVAANRSLRLHSRSLGASALAWYAAPALTARAKGRFPRCMSDIPVVLPTSNAAIRPALDAWFERMGIRPRVVAEVEDSALLKTLASGGMGAFAAATLVERALRAQYRVARIGPCDGAEEQFFAVSAERRLMHPLIRRLRRAE